MMKKMEEILDFREEVDVVEIQAQEYEYEELTYPYWDPFTLDRTTLTTLYEVGYEITQQTLQERLQPMK